MATKWNQLPDKKIIETTLAKLQENGIDAFFVETPEEAKEKALSLIPENAEVMTMTSVTLDIIGLANVINESGKFDAAKPKLMSMDRKTQAKQMRQLGAAPDIAVGSVHAITQDGHVMIASKTGSQLPAYAYGAGKVIWVAGAQKIVKDINEGTKRIFEYVLPLESERANKAYNMTMGSNVDKLLTIYKELVPQRLTLILVNEILGF